MTPLLARLRQAARWTGAALVLLGVVTWAWLRRRASTRLVGAPIDEAVERYRRETAVASARAAVQIEAARTPLRIERAQLLDILRDDDEDRQAQRLIEAARRIRGE
ncbi:MAG TPA: hypothetical protein VJ140_07785 [Actinomycetota bacterium]|nr:hypothetical protein [Actinomycetota bacterium]